MYKQSIDQLGRQIEHTFPPQRIISLVPSQTELLINFGLEKEMVGRTKFCIYPTEEVKKIEIVGGTKNLRIDKILDLRPDLIIANKEENTKEQIDLLAKKIPTWISDVNNFENSITLIESLGVLTGKLERSQIIIKRLKGLAEDYKSLSYPKRKVVYFIWKKPYMVAGMGTFIDSMLKIAGFENVISVDRYPVMTLDQLSHIKTDLVLLSSEPYPFKKKHIKELSSIFPSVQVVIVNGEYFSWYGSRLNGAFTYFKSLQEQIHQNVLREK